MRSIVVTRSAAILLAVVGLLVALIGMHALMMPTAASEAAPEAMTTHAAAVDTATMNTGMDQTATNHAATKQAAIMPDLVDDEMPGGHDATTAMACAMGLLTLAAAVVVARARRLLTPRHDPRLTLHSPVTPAELTAHPPSLVELSISRT